MRDALRRGWHAAAFVYDLAAGERDTWVKRAAGPVEVTSTSLRGPRRAIPCDLYRAVADDANARPLLVVTHGFTHEGHADRRLQALCRRLARLGFLVAAPEFDEMRQYRLGLDDTADLEAVVGALRTRPDADPGRVGVMAFSFGAVPALIGLARPPLRHQVQFAVVFGGCFDLKQAFRYVLTGAYDGFGHRGRRMPPTEGDDRWKFLRGNLRMIPPSNTSPVLAAAAAARVADPSAPVDIAACTAEEQAAWALIENRDPDRYEALYDAAGAHVHAWFDRLSPVHTADGIRARLFLVHSFTDQKTPFVESIAMSRGVPHAPPPTLTLLNAFAHVDLRLNWRSLPSLLRDGLPGLVAVWRIVRDVMRAARL